jgi:hypothetical protein
MMALDASIGEPPPTDTMMSALFDLNVSRPLWMPAIGACCPISENVPACAS